MNIALIGYGKMGKTIEGIILEAGHDEVTLKISADSVQDFTKENLQKCDVAIEFTQPESAVENIYKCFDAGIPVVVGTTAWLHQLDEVKKVCAEKNGALLFSPNFSIGVNIFWEANKKLARLMNRQPQYNVSIEESHHTEKKDIPSGTAVRTAEILLTELDAKSKWTLNSVGDLNDELLIVAKREPHVPGTHIVTYTSSVDEIQIKHEAFNRRGFAEGAILAARWLVGKKGVFEISDLLSDSNNR